MLTARIFREIRSSGLLDSDLFRINVWLADGPFGGNRISLPSHRVLSISLVRFAREGLSADRSVERCVREDLVGVVSQRPNRRDADNNDESEHHRVFDGRWPVFTTQEIAHRFIKAPHWYGPLPLLALP